MVVDPTILKRIGDNLRSLREAQNLSQRELARISGVSLSTIKRMESGTTHARMIKFIRVCDALNVSVTSALKI